MVTSSTTNNAIDKDDVEAGHNEGGAVMAESDDADDGNDAGHIKHPVGVDKDNNDKDNDNDHDNDNENDDDDDDYVTYIRPKQIKILPPAKYKLFVVTFVAVWFAGTS